MRGVTPITLSPRGGLKIEAARQEKHPGLGILEDDGRARGGQPVLRDERVVVEHVADVERQIPADPFLEQGGRVADDRIGVPV